MISVRGLRKSYGDVEAVRGIDLEVSNGEIFAFLGPNGAGKTTTVEILEGYRERSEGEVSVLGIDPQRAGRDWRQRVGFVLQESRLVPELTPRETIEQYAGYYASPRDVDETVRLVGLALIGDPELLFLDEPTTGFDPAARRQFWSLIFNLSRLGKTIFLTTHYMEEAQFLADRAAIIVGGQIIARGRPDEIGRGTGAETEVRFRLPAGVGVGEIPVAASSDDGFVTIRTGEPVQTRNHLTGWAQERGLALAGL